ncbi:MAG: hypothetical protein FWC53_00645 [Firmicutes bacterium]|nr:hypothetical protein [Bacillota bacterium]
MATSDEDVREYFEEIAALFGKIPAQMTTADWVRYEELYARELWKRHGEGLTIAHKKILDSIRERLKLDRATDEYELKGR